VKPRAAAKPEAAGKPKQPKPRAAIVEAVDEAMILESGPVATPPGSTIPPPTFHVPVGPARQRLRDALAWVEDFAAELRRLATVEGPLPWAHAEGLELVGLERWGTQLAKSDREAAVCALVLAAEYGFPKILEAGGSVLDDMGYRGDEVMDGASVEALLDRAARWVDEPSEVNRQHVQDGFDPTRQLHVWEDDLRPTDASAYHWYYEVGQCVAAAIVKGKGDADHSSYYYWPADVSCGRGLVVAARGLRGPGAPIEAIVRELYRAMTM
jgi:hypothetical protein